jgi:phospholipase/carboxylesterase
VTDYLSCVEIDAPTEATGSVVWLHGLGADGHDFEPIVPYLGLDPELSVRFVFPHAPKMPVTINGGMVMRAWYDITDIDLDRRQDEAHIRSSAEHVARLLARENDRGVPTSKIVLAGFSQGGAIALHQGLRHPERLAGILALSCYLVLPEAAATERSEANAGQSIFMGHGTFDPVVPVGRGEASRDLLQKMGYEVEWRSYPMQHQVHPQEITHVGAWLNQRLGASA